MPPKAARGSRKKHAKGRKRGNDEEAASDPQSSAQLTPAMSDVGDEQKQVSSDADTPMSKKAKHESAAAVAGASIAAAESAAAAAGAPSSSSAAAVSSAPTPCARLDSDSLSVVFSLLNMRDFFSAIRVCRQWRAARTKKSAWTAFSLETMTQSLRDDNFDNPHRRKLQLTVETGDNTTLGALLSKPGVMELLRHVTEVRIVQGLADSPLITPPTPKQIEASLAMMSLLPQFASLSALTLDGFGVEEGADGPVVELFSALSSRLFTLGLRKSSQAFESQLHRLSSLRVLVLGWIPEADALLPLRQLVYLHFQREGGDSEASVRLALVIRRLSGSSAAIRER